LVKQAVELLRRDPAWEVSINLFTNGLLLDEEKAAFLRRWRVRLILSLDGGQKTNDRNRVFADGTGRSSFERIMERARLLPLEDLGVNMVFTSETVEALPDNVAFLHGQGFRRIDFYPALYEGWPEGRLAALEAGLRRVADDYSALFKAPVPAAFLMQGVSMALERLEPDQAGRAPWWGECRNLVLGSDGNFHSCDKAMSLSASRRKESVVGDPESGVSWRKRSAHYARARRLVEERGQSKRGYLYCPMGVMLRGRWQGREAGPALQDFDRVNDAMAGFYLGILDRLREQPVFREMYHIQARCQT
ncbi:MAG: hypothetical protein KGK30_08785, partial [Elusimicrobia bacterium]|nr:hypothetical protein [Elusimicrobiota bacterium]